MDLVDLKGVSEIVQSWLSSAAIVIGSLWALWRFVLQREAHPRIEFAVDLNVLGRVGDDRLVNVIATITNRGNVRHYLRDFWFVVNHRKASDPIKFGGAEIDGQVEFTRGTRKCYWIQEQSEKYFIDAGVTQKYTHVTTIPATSDFVLIYGRMRYPGFRERYQPVQQAFALPAAQDAPIRTRKRWWPVLAGFVAGAVIRRA